MLVSANSYQRIDSRIFTGFDIGLAEISSISYDFIELTELFG